MTMQYENRDQRSNRERNDIAECYYKNYFERYHIEPIIEDSELAVLKGMLGKYPADRLKETLFAFFRMDDPYFVDRGHSIKVFRESMAKITAFLGQRKHSSQENKKIRILNHLENQMLYDGFLMQGDRIFHQVDDEWVDAGENGILALKRVRERLGLKTDGSEDHYKLPEDGH